ncbi:MAG: hypothetical protein H6819_00705 [Phycisphaerales bacterium]|nr:hypothetical protein [Phycisphaerales bacterium]MCB9857272.1 hypothetical protein [Phycisphaerales bacterium]MCB9863014.1 hypothetical protein [Phycisphaerales bacterium]
MTQRTVDNRDRRTLLQGMDWRKLLHRKSIWRIVWLLLFAMHLPATVKVYGSATAVGEPTAWSSLILLAVTNIFFILEITFAWSLRVLSDRRCLIAFILIVALMHAGVLDRVMPDVIADQGIGLLLFVSTAASFIAHVVMAVARRTLESSDSAGLNRYLASLRRRYSLGAFATVRIPRFSPHRRACALRAPPIR